MVEPKSNELMEKIASLCKRRGFIFQSSEIYGGINGFWDYGPLGAELKRNVKELWWRSMTQQREDVVGLEASIIMHPKIWEASGHTSTFSDPMVDCLGCKKRFRADQIEPQSGVACHYRGAGSGVSDELCKLAALAVKRWDDSGATLDPTLSNALKEAVGDSAELRRDKNRAIEFLAGPKPETRLRGREILASFANQRRSNDEFSCLLPDEKNLESARKKARIYYEMRGVAYPNLEGERSEKVENTTRYCNECGSVLTPPKQFNLMFKTYVGPVEDTDSVAYLRPETAQAIFAQFKTVLEVSRQKVPFGIAQIGKAFRNEINPRNFTFRSREFEQMELEFFIRPDEVVEAISGRVAKASEIENQKSGT